MGFLVSKVDRGPAPDSKPPRGRGKSEPEPEVVVHKPSCESERWLSLTPHLLRSSRNR